MNVKMLQGRDACQRGYLVHQRQTVAVPVQMQPRERWLRRKEPAQAQGWVGGHVEVAEGESGQLRCPQAAEKVIQGRLVAWTVTFAGNVLVAEGRGGRSDECCGCVKGARAAPSNCKILQLGEWCKGGLDLPNCHTAAEC